MLDGPFEVRAAARALVERYRRSAGRMVEAELSRKIGAGEVGDALHLDQVRREIENIYEVEGKRAE